MATSVSHDIRIDVRPCYEAAHSDPKLGKYVFSYRITITNGGSSAVQLLRRSWTIWDSLAPLRKVEGPGVVGETPVIDPGGSYTYSSFCDLRSSMGRMHGSYLMERVGTCERFVAPIPAFDLLAPWLGA
jgi:ApaG protein